MDTGGRLLILLATVLGDINIDISISGSEGGDTGEAAGAASTASGANTTSVVVSGLGGGGVPTPVPTPVHTPDPTPVPTPTAGQEHNQHPGLRVRPPSRPGAGSGWLSGEESLPGPQPGFWMVGGGWLLPAASTAGSCRTTLSRWRGT